LKRLNSLPDDTQAWAQGFQFSLRRAQSPSELRILAVLQTGACEKQMEGKIASPALVQRPRSATGSPERIREAW
jgi:hypothetical protein